MSIKIQTDKRPEVSVYQVPTSLSNKKYIAFPVLEEGPMAAAPSVVAVFLSTNRRTADFQFD
jgi:hypothetical protein